MSCVRAYYGKHLHALSHDIKYNIIYVCTMYLYIYYIYLQTDVLSLLPIIFTSAECRATLFCTTTTNTAVIITAMLLLLRLLLPPPPLPCIYSPLLYCSRIFLFSVGAPRIPFRKCSRPSVAFSANTLHHGHHHHHPSSFCHRQFTNVPEPPRVPPRFVY